MSVFDQRGQRVTYQNNAACNINFGAIQNRMELVAELEKLQAELVMAVQADVFDEETATDTEYQMKKAVQEAKKPAPEKKKVLQHLQEAKALIERVAAAVGLVKALAKAAQMVQAII